MRARGVRTGGARPRVSGLCTPGRGRVGGAENERACTPREDGCNQVDAEYLRVGSQGHFRVPGR